MSNKHEKFFQPMTQKTWRNLIITAVLTIFIITIGFIIINSPNLEFELCGHLAYDYCAYWSVGRVINQNGWKTAYNLDLLADIQRQISPHKKNSINSFKVCPVPYLPPFLLPFQLLSLFQVSYSFYIWTLLNIVSLILYLNFFTQKLTQRPIPIRFILLILISAPVILNLLLGQINIFLAICVGELLRAALSQKPFKAGLWLGGLLLKPQLLILILLFLVIWKEIKILAGFIVSSSTILGLSLIFGGLDGLSNLMNLIFEYSEGSPTNYIAGMINWRMLGWHIKSFTSDKLGWVTIILGSLIVLSLSLFTFRKKSFINSNKFVIAILGIFAATGVLTWHAHIHISVILIPPLLYLLLKKQMEIKLILIWALFPILFNLAGYIITALLTLNGLSPVGFEIIPFSEGFPGFVMNLLILGWSINQYSRHNRESNEDLLGEIAQNEKLKYLDKIQYIHVSKKLRGKFT